MNIMQPLTKCRTCNGAKYLQPHRGAQPRVCPSCEGNGAVPLLACRGLDVEPDTSTASTNVVDNVAAFRASLPHHLPDVVRHSAPFKPGKVLAAILAMPGIRRACL